MNFFLSVPSISASGSASRLQWPVCLRTVASLCSLLLLLSSLGCGGTSYTPNQGPLTVTSFTATSSAISIGQSTNLVWAETGAVSLSISDGTTTLAPSTLTAASYNSITVSPTVTTTYTLTATDAHGNIFTTNGVKPTATVTVVNPPVIHSFTASASTITQGGSVTLSWDVADPANTTTTIACLSNNCSFLTGGDSTVVPVSGTSVTFSPSVTSKYQLVATNAAGTPITMEVTVAVVTAPNITRFEATPPSIGTGESTNLSWSVSGATSITITDNLDSNVYYSGTSLSSSVSVQPSQTETYTLTATNMVGTFPATATAKATVTVSQNAPPFISSFIATPASGPKGGYVTLTPVFTPTDATATFSECAGTEAQCSSASAFVNPQSVVSGQVISLDPNTNTTYQLTVTNSAGSAMTTTRVLVGDLTTLVSFPEASSQMENGQFYYGFSSIAVDNSGNLYVVDQGDDVIQKITPAGVVSTYAGDGNENTQDGVAQCTSSPGTTVCAEFYDPSGIAVDPAGNVYVAENAGQYGGGTAKIRMISSATPAMVSTIAGVDSATIYQDGAGSVATFSSPNGMAVDATGNHLYIADSDDCNIRMITNPSAGAANNSVSTFAGQAQVLAANGNLPNCGNHDGAGAAATLNHPWDVAVDTNGYVYVADTDNKAIRKITPQQDVSTFGSGVFPSNARPSGVAVDPSGNVYVWDAANYEIYRLSPDGSTEDVIVGGGPNTTGKTAPKVGDTASLPGNIHDATDFAIDPTSGNLFITSYDYFSPNEYSFVVSVPY